MKISTQNVKTLIVCNRASGSFDANAEHLDAFRPHEACVVAFNRQTNLVQVIQDALHTGFDTIIAAGGDGTVNAIVNAIMAIALERRPKLGILPLGTANDFAGTLCIPDDVNDAIKLFRHARCIPIDVIRIRAAGFERHYANVAAGGNSVRVTEELTPEMKSRWGAFCYLRGALKVLTDLESYRINVSLDDEYIEQMQTWAVLVANGKTNAGRIVVAPYASPRDGLMDVILIRDGSVLDMMSIVGNAVLGNYLDSEQVVHRQVRHLQLDSMPNMRFTLDGEVIDKQPVVFDVIPGAIEMFVGDDFQPGF